MLPLLFALFDVAHAVAPPDRPTAIVRAGLGFPELIGGRAEVFVADAWSIEAGGGLGVEPPLLLLGARWSPEQTCWGCWDGHGLRLAPGVTWYVFPTLLQEGLITVNADLSWVWRSAGGVGMTAGVRVGAGPAYGSANGAVKIEPGIDLTVAQVGLIF